MRYLLWVPVLMTLIISSCAHTTPNREPADIFGRNASRYSPWNNIFSSPTEMPTNTEELKKEASALLASYDNQRNEIYDQMKTTFGLDIIEPLGETVFRANVSSYKDEYGRISRSGDDLSYTAAQFVCISREASICTGIAIVGINNIDPKYTNGLSNKRIRLVELKMPFYELVTQDFKKALKKANYGEQKVAVESAEKDFNKLFDIKNSEKYSYMNKAANTPYISIDYYLKAHYMYELDGKYYTTQKEFDEALKSTQVPNGANR